MPGTVQVSILELTGLPSSTSSSSKSIKVSLGKHTYETQGEKGDFFFPLATLRDNLVVKVHDAEGNEVAHTGVKSRFIAEKGFWDDLFPLEGGGHVHMRLKFSLSEEERNKIRDMRESALRKKREELLNKSHKDLGTAVASSGGRDEMAATTAISRKAHSFDLPQEASSKVVSSKSSSKPYKSPVSVLVKEDTQHHNLKEQNQLEKTPSKVRETIAAFESSLLLEERMPDVNSTTAKPQSSRETMDAPSKDQTSESTSARNIESPIYHIEKVLDPSSKRVLERPTSSKDKTGRMETHSTSYESKCVENLEHGVESKGNSRENPFIKELSRSSNWEQYRISGRVRPEISGRRQRCSCYNFHGWIFLEEAACSCIASDNRAVVDLLGDYNVNTKIYPEKLVGNEVASSKDEKLSGVTKKPESDHSSVNGTSRGPNGQVMKIVIMVGFGLLVLLTRKRKSR